MGAHGTKEKAQQTAAENIGKRLSRIRKERGYTQTAFAKAMCITQNTLSDYESGKTRISGELLARFATALCVTGDELLGLRKRTGRPPTPPSVKLLKRMERIQKLPPDVQNEIIKSLDMLIRGAKQSGR